MKWLNGINWQSGTTQWFRNVMSTVQSNGYLKYDGSDYHKGLFTYPSNDDNTVEELIKISEIWFLRQPNRILSSDFVGVELKHW